VGCYEREVAVGEASDLQRALGECWSAEVSGVSYYEALSKRLPERRQEFGVLALVERTTRDIIEAVARRFEVSIDTAEAERVGSEVAKLGDTWGEVLRNALAYTPETMRMYQNLADLLPEGESAVGEAIVEHERAQIVLYESAVAGQPDDWSAIDAFLDRFGSRR
jgi:hypothetical protein